MTLDELRTLRVALIHDWLTGMRGGEKVLEAFCELFPEADIYTLLHNPGSVSPTIERHRIRTSFIDRLPGKATRYPYYLPLFPTAIELFDLKGYDLILSTSHCVAKGVRTPPDARHICYIHTPMRYVWDMYEDYFGPGRAGRLKRVLIPPFATYLRMWDVASANRVDHFIANSAHVARRVARYYRRSATVIHPPVALQRYQPGVPAEDFYLIVSALVPYKRIDLAVAAFNRIERPLVIVGDGPEKARLQEMAGPTVSFREWLSDAELDAHFNRCRALIFPGEEDFGIVPVEAQACGKPVVALRRGGALETVVGYDGGNEGRCTGIFFDRPDAEALAAVVKQLETLTWDGEWIRAHAARFGREGFLDAIAGFIGARMAADPEIGSGDST